MIFKLPPVFTNAAKPARPKSVSSPSGSNAKAAGKGFPLGLRGFRKLKSNNDPAFHQDERNMKVFGGGSKYRKNQVG